VNQSLRVQHSLGRFEPGALAPFATRPTASQHADRGLAACVVASPIEALVARFPVIRRLVGDEWFRAMARRFIVSEPARSPSLLHYGETFPRFLRRLNDTASIEYVADIAELEMLQRKAYHAADALPVGARAFSSLRADKHNGVRVVLHTVGVPGRIAFPDRDFPRRRSAMPALGRSCIHQRPRRGHTMATATAAGRAVAPDFNLASNLAILGEANIVVGFREDA
jgi:hypothetical protein